MLTGHDASGPVFRVAGFWRRTLAAILDALVLAPLVVIFGGAASTVAGGYLPRLGELGFGYVVHLALDGGPAGVAALFVAFTVVLLYLLIFSTITGQTPGKRALGIRVINAYGEALSVPRALVRAAGQFLSVALFSLGWLWIAFSREKRGLHDLIAGTYVVRTGAGAAPEAITVRPSANAPAGAP